MQIEGDGPKDPGHGDAVVALPRQIMGRDQRVGEAWSSRA
jgi:hypothetical protein